MISLGKQTINSQHPDFLIYSINIFTDLDWAFSGISFDNLENSLISRQKHIAETQKAVEYLMAAGCPEKAKQLSVPARAHYHGGFEFFHRLVEVNHESFIEGWQYEPDNRCWQTLEPLSQQIGLIAQREFADLNLHEDAELSVSGENSWSQYIFSLAKSKR